MTAAILTIGDELLIGQIVNTNAAWIGDQLTHIGIEVARMISVGDDEAEIGRALAGVLDQYGVVVITGGLGPTHDDVTKKAVADLLGVGFTFDEEMFARVRERFERRGVPMPESNRSQAMVPVGFEALPNPVGTAPGLWCDFLWQGKRRMIAILPGVPSEMKVLMQEEVLPRLKRQEGRVALIQKTLLTAGIGESNLAERIGDLSEWLGPSLRLAFLPGGEGVRLRITARGDDEASARRRLEAFEAFLRARAAAYIYGEGTDTLEAVVGALLLEQERSIAVAESCTGGALLSRLTDVPGCSAYVMGGVVAYGNGVKVNALGVDPEVLAEDGAVSRRVALLMAAGVREHLGADIGLSTTGIAGPGGGTPEKPVGTVWIGYADAEHHFAVLLRLGNDRLLNKQLTVTAALNIVRRQLLKQGIPAGRGG